MRKLIAIILAAMLCAGTVAGCSGGSVGAISPDEISLYYSNDDYNDEDYPEQVIISLPNPDLGTPYVGEIINKAGIEYEYINNNIYFDASEKVIFTFEAFDADGVRLNYACLYPEEQDINVNMAKGAYRGREVATWFAYLDPVVNTVSNEVRLMAWVPYNDSNGDIIGISKFMRTSETPSFRPLVIPYESDGRMSLAGASGMDAYLRFGNDAEDAIWNEIPDQSRNVTKVLEVTVGENYLPDENGIRFIGVGSGRSGDSPDGVLIICDVPSLEISYDGKTETFNSFNGVIYARLRFSLDERKGDAVIVNGKEYPKVFFGEYQRNYVVIIDEQCGQPVFSENDIMREYTITLASVEK